MIEFALIAPVLLMLFLGVFEMGRLVVYWIAIQQGAQETARYASVSSTTQANIIQYARNQTGLIGAGLVDCSGHTITSSTCTSQASGAIVVSCTQDSDGDSASGCTRSSDDYVRVQITYPFQPFPLVYPFGTLRISSWAQARVE